MQSLATVVRSLTAAAAIVSLSACATSTTCEKPESPELTVRHFNNMLPPWHPIWQIALDRRTLSITSDRCYETRCVTLAENDVQKLRDILTSPDLIQEINEKQGSECITSDIRAVSIAVPSGFFGRCHQDLDDAPNLVHLLAVLDEIADRYFGWRYGHTLTKGPTLLQRLIANDYRCPAPPVF